MKNPITTQFTSLKTTIDNVNGRIGVPVLMYFLGVPGFVCILAWLLFFRGR